MFKSIWKNPEFKSIFNRFIVIYLIFAILLLTVLNLAWRNFEVQRISREVQIIGKLLRDSPEDEQKVITAFTEEINTEDVKKGLEIVQRYGMTNDVEMVRYSRYYPIFLQTAKQIIVILNMGFVCFLLILLLFNKQITKRLQVIAQGAERIMDGNFLIKLPAEGEGDLALVGFQFNQMAHRLCLSLEDLKREKALLKDLISNISHQLKTPLATLQTYNELLLEGAMDDVEVREEFLVTSRSQLQRMEWLVQTMLKISRLEAGVITMSFHKNSLTKTVEDVITSLALRCIENEQQVNLHNTAGPLLYEHDKAWLGEAIENILKNAIDFTPHGKSMDVVLEESETVIRIIISDQGVGIPEHELPHIFKQFYQGTQRMNNGSGVGLALSRSIVQKHGGMIHVESKVGAGSTFIITFPKLRK